MSYELKNKVLNANKWIVDKKLVELTWGNVSAYNRNNNQIYIKPSGVALDKTTAEQISVLTSEGHRLDGLKPSVDTPTHIALYKHFETIECVIHTHSKYSTIFAQAGREIPCLGTTHADYFNGPIPCIAAPSAQNVEQDYEMNTGLIICKHFDENNVDYKYMNACLVSGHGVFVWGSSVDKALENAYVLELVAEMAYKTLMLNPLATLEDYILDKHFMRKHGKTKYYGQ